MSFRINIQNVRANILSQLVCCVGRSKSPNPRGGILPRMEVIAFYFVVKGCSAGITNQCELTEELGLIVLDVMCERAVNPRRYTKVTFTCKLRSGISRHRNSRVLVNSYGAQTIVNIYTTLCMRWWNNKVLRPTKIYRYSFFYLLLFMWPMFTSCFEFDSRWLSYLV